MPRFLIEVPHEEETVACARAIKVLLETGSHFLTHAEYGCEDGVHKAWIIVDMDTKEQARSIVPAAYRRQATVVGLCTFGLEEINGLLKHHEP